MLSPGDEVVFVDDGRAGQQANGARILSFDSFAALAGDRAICLAVANASTRRALDQRCRGAGIPFFSPRSAERIQMDDVEIGEGALLSPYTTLTSNIRIGRHFHQNLYSYVEHDCVIGDFVTFAPAVRCNGNVRIGDDAYVGAGALIRQGLEIGAGATIGMGAVVVRDVPPGETWVGNPAAPLRR
jgi:sugar O-acyltransferase (sialic acid O-acetyltransferase NeuD family)